jgi:hypothetical protein
MDSGGAADTATKGRVLVDALLVCLERSKVAQAVDAQTLRGVIESALGELWREGEFRLQTVWKILTNQPGLTAKDVAPPMILFKMLETQLAVVVRLPDALTAVPKSDHARLLGELGVSAEEMAAAVAELQAKATAEAAAAAEAVAQAAAAAQAARAAPAPQPAKPQVSYQAMPVERASRRKRLAVAFFGVAVLAFAGAMWLTFADTSSSVETTDVSSILQLSGARRANAALSARITDPRWPGMLRDEQRRVAEQLFDQEVQKGVRSMTLTDGDGRLRVIATEAGGHRSVLVQ